MKKKIDDLIILGTFWSTLGVVTKGSSFGATYNLMDYISYTLPDKTSDSINHEDTNLSNWLMNYAF